MIWLRLSVVCLLGYVPLLAWIGALASSPVSETHVPSPEPPFTSAPSLFAVATPSEERFVAVGEDGVMITSTDGGATWGETTIAEGVWLLDVAFVGPEVGWTVGRAGAVLRTEDGGRTWQDRSAHVAENLHAVWVEAPCQVWVAGSDGRILRTSDCGHSWHSCRLAYDGVVRRLFFQGTTGWAAGDHGMILHSDDGGMSWHKLAPETVGSRVNLYGIAFVDAGTGLAWGDEGTLLTTENGGLQWWKRRLDPPLAIQDVLRAVDGRPVVLTNAGAMYLDRLRVEENGGAVEVLSLRRADRQPDLLAMLEHLVLRRSFDIPGTGRYDRRYYRAVVLEDGGLIAVGSRGLIARGRGAAPSSRIVLAPLRAGASRLSRARRLAEIAGSFLDSPYGHNPLGEGPGGRVDRDPRLATDRFDCVTLIEQALAFEVAGSPGADVLPVLDRIRYRAGRVSFFDRHHFFVPDWIPHNSWLVEDVTSSVGGGAARLLTRTVGKMRFLESYGLDHEGFHDQERSTWIIPAAEIATVEERLEHGMIVVLIGRRSWLFATHTGILVRPADGSPIRLRHASGSAGRVVDEDFFGYLRRGGGRFRGIKLLRVVD